MPEVKNLRLDSGSSDQILAGSGIGVLDGTDVLMDGAMAGWVYGSARGH